MVEWMQVSGTAKVGCVGRLDVLHAPLQLLSWSGWNDALQRPTSNHPMPNQQLPSLPYPDDAQPAQSPSLPFPLPALQLQVMMRTGAAIAWAPPRFVTG